MKKPGLVLGLIVATRCCIHKTRCASECYPGFQIILLHLILTLFHAVGAAVPAAETLRLIKGCWKYSTTTTTTTTTCHPPPEGKHAGFFY